MIDDSTLRLNKAMSDTGTCSRREADTYIQQGRVYVNGIRAEIGDRVYPRDEIRLDGRVIKESDRDIFIALNKPVGIVSTTDKLIKDNIISYINYPKRIYPIGRLDKDSEGLIFLTNNGGIVNKILRAGNNHEKEYVVTVNRQITQDFIDKMGNGVPVLGETTKKCFVKKEAEFIFRIILVQGLNRQIRRMCEHFGYEVIRLKRVRIMNVTLERLPEGEWRDLEKNELDFIFEAIKNSKDEPEKKPSSRPKSSNSTSKSKPKPESESKTKPKTSLKGKGSVSAGSSTKPKEKKNYKLGSSNTSPSKTKKSSSKGTRGKR